MKHRNMKVTIGKSNEKRLIYYIPILIIIGVIPLITRGKILVLSMEEARFWRGGTTHVDFFNYYKSIALLICTFFSTILYGTLSLNNKLLIKKEKQYYLPMLIYIITVILSALMSNNKTVAFYGFIEMRQGFFILCSYTILTFIMINFITGEKDIRIFLYAFVFVIIAEGILGISQYFGYDFFRSEIGKKLIMPSELKDAKIKFIFDKYTIPGTMYNTNFVGSFGALILPLITIMYLKENNKIKNALFCGAAFFAFATWLGCNSRAGYLGITAAFFIGIVILRKIIRKHFKKVLILFAGFLTIAFIFNTASKGRVFNQFSRLNPAVEVEKIQNIGKQQHIRFEELSVKENVLIIKTNKETLVGIMQDSNFIFEDESGRELDINTDDKVITFADEKYSGYSFTMYEDRPSYIKVDLYGRSLHLYITNEQNLRVISFNSKLTVPIKAPRVKWFDGKETFASNRGYIWSRSIPLLRNALLIGYGPDNYPMVFPQEDYVGRFNVGIQGVVDMVIDKPHNMYLQTAINTGVISLLALIAIWGIYLFDSLKLYIKGNMESFTEYMGAATFLSITAYLVAGIFNDNVISVAPLFWILLGMGIGINNMIRTQN